MDNATALRRLRKVRSTTDSGVTIDAINVAVKLIKEADTVAKNHPEKSVTPVLPPQQKVPVEVIIDPEGKNIGPWSEEEDAVLRKNWALNIGVSRIALNLNRHYKTVESRVRYLFR